MAVACAGSPAGSSPRAARRGGLRDRGRPQRGGDDDAQGLSRSPLRDAGQYALASVGGALAAGAVGTLDVSLLLYPVYYCLANAAIALLIFVWRWDEYRAG